MDGYTFARLREALPPAAPRPVDLPDATPLTADRLARLRAEPALRPLLAEARAEAERASATPIPGLPFSHYRLFETAGTREEYQRPYFDRRRRLLGLGLTALVEETDRYDDALQDLIWELCNEYTWALPASLPVGAAASRASRLPPEQVIDLFAAETAHALAETLLLLGHRLDPWMDYRIRTEIERRVFHPLFHDPVHFWWESSPSNWAAVCAGAVGMAALLLEADRDRLAGMLDRVLRALDVFLEGYGEDGASPEGIAYWAYGFGYYVYFAEMLHASTAGRIDLLAAPGEKIRRIAEFPLGVGLGGDAFVNFSDAPAHCALPTGLVSRLAARLGQRVPEMTAVPSLHADHCYRWAHATRNLAWTDPALLHRPTPEGATWFPDRAWVVDRRRLAGTMVAFAARGGDNGEHHNHNDLGHFILHLGGEHLLVDLGQAPYTRDYFGPGRYGALHAAAAGHSVPILDGRPQAAGAAAAAKVVRYDPGPPLVFALDLTAAYPESALVAFVRTFAWTIDADAAARLEITDALRFRGSPGEAVELFVSLHRPTVDPTAGKVRWQGAAGAVVLAYDVGRFAATVEILPSQDHHGLPLTVYRLCLACPRPRQQETWRFSFRCVPGSAAGATDPVALPAGRCPDRE